MDPNIHTPPASSVITDSSSLSCHPPPPPPPASANSHRILEISLISAQDLSPVSKSLRSYALTWINPNRKRTTRVDNHGHTNPTWNDKFSFRVDDEFLSSDSSTVHVEIYTVSWFRDVLVGTVHVLVNDLIRTTDTFSPFAPSLSKRFVALQIRRPSGNPQGILNMGVALHDSTMHRSKPLYTEIIPTSLDYRDILDQKMKSFGEQDYKTIDYNQEDMMKHQMNYDEEFPNKDGSVYNGSILNGSMLNGSELCSDIGPSASIVAAEIAKRSQPPALPPPRRVEADDGGSSILEELTIEEAYAKGLTTKSMERWGTEEDPPAGNGHSRRSSDGGLFSCFGNAYGCEFTIVCGGGKDNKKGNGRVDNKNSRKSRRKWSSETS